MSSTGTIAWVCLSLITTQCEHTGCPVSLSKNSKGLLLCSGQPTAVSLLKNCTRDSKTYLIVVLQPFDFATTVLEQLKNTRKYNRTVYNLKVRVR